MAEQDAQSGAKNYHLSEHAAPAPFPVKGAQALDWGMQNRLSHIFGRDGRTVMLAFDHGYIMGPTLGLERLDLVIPPLMDSVDTLMCTRGAAKTCVPSFTRKGLVLRATAGSSVLKEDMSLEHIGVDMEDALRLDADSIAIQSFIGSENEAQSVRNICEAVNAGNRFGMPVLGVVAVGKQMERTTRFFLLATRMLAEFGVQIVKSYYCEDFENVVAACPVPLVVAGGKKLPEKEALDMVYQSIIRGAAGVDMGRNVFQAENPAAMAAAVGKIVHDGFTAQDGYAFYRDACHTAR